MTSLVTFFCWFVCMVLDALLFVVVSHCAFTQACFYTHRKLSTNKTYFRLPFLSTETRLYEGIIHRCWTSGQLPPRKLQPKYRLPVPLSNCSEVYMALFLLRFTCHDTVQCLEGKASNNFFKSFQCNIVSGRNIGLVYPRPVPQRIHSASLTQIKYVHLKLVNESFIWNWTVYI